jgi:hypothetical protein
MAIIELKHELMMRIIGISITALLGARWIRDKIDSNGINENWKIYYFIIIIAMLIVGSGKYGIV